MENNWSKSGNNYRIAEISQQMKKLPAAIYKYQLDIFEQPYLSEISEKFDLPTKIYQTERPFIERVKKSWANTTGNFGILLNGVKGTGKSITAEIIANEMNLPVIIIPFKHKSITSFINDIQQDVVIFIDEYDKIFDRYDNSLLSVMDGVLKTDARVMFLMTSNEAHLERNMLQRPSRIRYVKTYGDLPIDVIMEIVDDMLIHKHLRNQTIKFISKLSIITMDLVKCIIQEVNIHEEDPKEFKDFFNISDGNKELYNVYKIEDGKKIEFKTKVTSFPESPFNSVHLEEELYVGGDEVGEIVQINSENEVIVEEQYKDDKTNEWSTRLVTYFIENSDRTHRSFVNFVF